MLKFKIIQYIIPMNRGIIFMKIAITTDSGSGISQEEAKRLGVTVIPMPFMIQDETYFEV